MAPESTPTKKDLSEEEKALIVEKAKEALKNAKSITIVNAEHLAETEARDAADAYMTESKKSAGFFKKLWKHTFMDEYYRQRELSRVRNEISTSGNIYTRVDQDKNAHDGAMSAIAERFALEHDEGISKNGGEERKILNEKDKDAVRTKTAIKALVAQYAQGSITDEVFNSEKNRIIGTLNDDLLKGANTYADNLFEIAKNAKLAIEHGAKLEELDLDFNIIVGKAKSSIKTEAKHNVIDKGVDWVKKSQIGRFVSPTVIATSLGIAYSAGAFFAKSVARSKASHIATLGGTALVAGALAAANESQRLAEERRQHAREMAKGGQIDGESPRRESMEKYAYETENAVALIAGLRDSLFMTDENGKEVPKQITEAEYKTVMKKITDIEARNALADRKKIDLISYSNPANVEKERTELVILLARSKVELRKQVEERLKSVLPAGVALNDAIKQQTEAACSAFLGGEKGINARDKAFSNLKLRRAAMKAGEAIALGLTVGAVTQEVLAAADGLWGGTKEGLVEGFMHNGGETGNTVQTPLENMRGWITGNPSHLAGELHDHVFDNNHIKLPEGVDIIKNADGTFNIIHGDQTISENIKLNFDASGHLDQDSIERLGEDGIIANSETVKIGGKEEVTTDPKDYVNKHPEATTHIKRELWYGNDTPMYRDPETGKLLGADQNELRTHWGGVKGTGVDANGNYVFNVAKMTPDGSYQTIGGREMSVDAQEKIKNGGLKMLLSFSKETQNHVVEVTIDKNGNAIFDHNDPAIKQLFSVDKNGHAVFNGKFAEVAQSVGVKDGIEHVKVLGTHVGKGIDSITHVVDSTKDVGMNTLSVPLDNEHPYFIPIVARKPLEPVSYKKKLESKKIEKEKKGVEPVAPFLPYYYNSESSSVEELDFYEKNKSQTLKENPQAKLDQYKEVGAYLSRMEKAYRARVEKFATELGEMDKECKVSVCIPVAGHQEGKQIYESLTNYSLQTAKTEEYEILLFVNHPEKDKEGNVLNADETLGEIERFKKENPKIKVKVMYEVLPAEDVNIGKIRKMLADATLVRQHERGEMAPDLIMISNDADNKGIDPRYIQAFIDQFNENQEVDAMLGQLDWDPESYQKYPAIHIGTRLFQYLSVIGRHRSGGMVSSGANSAFRSSMYAGIGGYMDNVQGGEDVAMGRAIVAARGGDRKRLTFAGTKTRLFTSSRRSIDALKSGLTPVEQWNKGFSAFDDEVRKMTMEQGDNVDYDNEEVQENLKKTLEYVINRTLDVWESGEALGKDSGYYRKALGWLGIRYTLDGSGNVIISDMKALVEGLKKYQIEGKLMRDARSGKKEAVDALKELRGPKAKPEKKKKEIKGLAEIAREMVIRRDAIHKKYQGEYADLISIKDDKVTSFDINKILDITKKSIKESGLRIKSIKQHKPGSWKVDIKLQDGKVITFGSIMGGAMAQGLRHQDRCDSLGSLIVQINNHYNDKGILEENFDVEEEPESEKEESVPEPEPNPTTPESKEEELTGAQFRTEMRAAFTEILKEKGGLAKIKKFEMDIVNGDRIVADVELDAGSFGGNPVISMILSVKDDKFFFVEPANITANSMAKGSVTKAVKEIPTKIKEVLGIKRGGNISKLSLEGNKLKLSLE